MTGSLQEIATVHARRMNLHQGLAGGQLGHGYLGKCEGGLVLWVA